MEKPRSFHLLSSSSEANKLTEADKQEKWSKIYFLDVHLGGHKIRFVDMLCRRRRRGAGISRGAGRGESVHAAQTLSPGHQREWDTAESTRRFPRGSFLSATLDSNGLRWVC